MRIFCLICDMLISTYNIVILLLFSSNIFSPICLNKGSIPIDSLAEVQLKTAPIFSAYFCPSFSVICCDSNKSNLFPANPSTIILNLLFKYLFTYIRIEIHYFFEPKIIYLFKTF